MRAAGATWDGDAKLVRCALPFALLGFRLTRLMHALQWHLLWVAYEPLQAALARTLTGDGAWELEPVPRFVRELLASRHVARAPSSECEALLAALPAARGAAFSLATDLEAAQRGDVLALLSRHGRGLLADETGLAGTRTQAIAAAACYASDWPLLVICASGAQPAWQAALAAWLPSAFALVHVVSGSRDAPLPLTSLAGRRLAVVVSYDLVASLDSGGGAAAFGVILADECHRLKGRDTQRLAAAMPRLRDARRLICLTSAPLFARPADLYTQLAALMPDAMPPFGAFAARYCAAKANSGGADYSGASCVAELQLLLERTVLVRCAGAAARTEQLPVEHAQPAAHVHAVEVPYALARARADAAAAAVPDLQTLSLQARTGAADDAAAERQSGGVALDAQAEQAALSSGSDCAPCTLPLMSSSLPLPTSPAFVYDVFLSYRREDRHMVDLIEDKLSHCMSRICTQCLAVRALMLTRATACATQGSATCACSATSAGTSRARTLT